MPDSASLQRNKVLRGTLRSSLSSLSSLESTAGDATAARPVRQNGACPSTRIAVTTSCGRRLGGERLERCKVDANEPLPFACPEGCVFYEPRKVSSAGWHVARDPDQP